MVNSLGVIPFDFEGQAVRVLDQKANPWFMLADVCRVLGIGNTSDAARRLDDDEKNTLDNIEGIHAGPGNPNVTIINESGLYSLILTSRKPEAKRFKKWVTAEVLPALRKHGSYSIEPRVSDTINTQNQILKLMERLQTTRNPAARRVIHRMLDDACRQLGIDTPQLEEIGRDAPQVPDIVQDFWNGLDVLRALGVQFDHSRKSDLLAVNLMELKEHFRKAGLRIKLDTPMRKALQQSQNPAFVAIKSVNSVSGKTVSCWVFQVAE